MAQQLAATLAAMTPTWCPADVVGRECPFGERRNCLDSARQDGLLVACWQAVLEQQTTDAADQRRQPQTTE